MVQANHCATDCFQWRDRVSVDVPPCVCGVLVAVDKAASGIDDEHFGVQSMCELVEVAATLLRVERVQAGKRRIAELVELFGA
jgi:hypothetical protein